MIAFLKTLKHNLLQYAGNGNINISRITAFLEFTLKPITENFCKNSPDEFCQDSCDYFRDLLSRNRRLIKNLGPRNWKAENEFYTVATDVKALYWNLCRDTATKTLECALEQERVRPVRLAGMISVIFGNQVLLQVHNCRRDEVYFTTLLWQNNGRKMALYRECCFPNCTKSWWI